MNAAAAILTLVLSLIGLVPPALPCSIPDYVVVVPSGGTVPANLPGIDVFGDKCPDLSTLPVVKRILSDRNLGDAPKRVATGLDPWP